MRERQRTGNRHRRHRSGERERRDDQYLAGGREIDDAVRHGNVELQRRIRIDDGVRERPRAKFFGRDAVRQANELEIVGDLAVAARKNKGNLVAQHQLRACHLQMADIDRNILRLGRAAEHVNHLEALTQLDQVAEVLECSRAPPARRVHDIGRSRSHCECDAAVRQRYVSFRIDGVEGDIARGGRE